VRSTRNERSDARLAARAGLLDLEALVAERSRDGIDDRRLVVDDENASGLAVRRHRTADHRAIVTAPAWESPVSLEVATRRSG